MQQQNAGTTERPLPAVLLEDLRELLTWDNNCYLTWVRLTGEAETESQHWFTIQFGSDGRRFGLRLEFWIPDWMDQRGVEAILPAHLAVAAIETGRWAAVDLGRASWSGVIAGLPKVARTCARLMNELWGPTTALNVLLLTLEYQDEQLETPFSGVPGYGGPTGGGE